MIFPTDGVVHEEQRLFKVFMFLVNSEVSSCVCIE